MSQKKAEEEKAEAKGVSIPLWMWKAVDAQAALNATDRAACEIRIANPVLQSDEWDGRRN